MSDEIQPYVVHRIDGGQMECALGERQVKISPFSARRNVACGIFQGRSRGSFVDFSSGGTGGR